MQQVVLKNISKQFKNSTIFKDINLIVGKGKSVAIKGKSGVGKSTLLNIFAGLEKPTSGQYFFDGEDLSQMDLSGLSDVRRRKIGYISQYSPMIPKLTVLENIVVPLWFEKARGDKNVITRRIEKISHLFEINHLLNYKIEKLSGGEIQRVGIIRSLIKEPQLIVADEPTGALDDETAFIILTCLNDLKKNGVSIIVATHNQMVAQHCDEVYQLTKEGLIPETVSSLPVNGSDTY